MAAHTNRPVAGYPVHEYAQLGSTFDVVEAGAPEGTSWVTLDQRAGHGRMGRGWQTPPGQALAACTLVRPGQGASWMPLAAASVIAAAAEALLPDSAPPPTVKWPNDVLVDGAKLSGILCRVVGEGPEVAVGYGINLVQQGDGLFPGATSLKALGAEGTADQLAQRLLEAIGPELVATAARLAAGGIEPVRDAVIARLGTLGQRVRAELPNGATLVGTAADLDAEGRLVVAPDEGESLALSAADVQHLRPAG